MRFTSNLSRSEWPKQRKYANWQSEADYLLLFAPDETHRFFCYSIDPLKGFQFKQRGLCIINKKKSSIKRRKAHVLRRFHYRSCWFSQLFVIKMLWLHKDYRTCYFICQFSFKNVHQETTTEYLFTEIWHTHWTFVQNAFTFASNNS